MYNTANNSFGKFEASIGPSATSFIMQSAYSELFPLHNGTTNADYFLKFEQKDALQVVIKREIVKVTARSGVLFTIERGAGLCPASDTATTQTNTAFSFSAGDSISLTVVSEHIQQMESDLAGKANDDEVVHLEGDETIDGVKTFSSSPKAPDPTDLDDVATKGYIDSQTGSITNLVQRNTFEFVAGESLVPGDILRFGLNLAGETISQNSGTYADIRDYVGYDTATTKTGQSFTVVNGGGLSNIKIILYKLGSPTGNLTLTIRDGASGSSNILFTSTNTIAESSLSGSQLEYTFNFEGIITPGVYYMDLSTSRANSTANYSVWSSSTGDYYAGGTVYQISSTGVWTSVNRDKRMIITIGGSGELPTKVYKAKASSELTSKVIGACFTTQALDTTFKGVIGGVLGGFTGLTRGEIYYLQNIGTIALTAGTTSVKVGKAISATEINFITPL